MIFRWYGYFSGKSNLHCTANLFSKELRKQALRGDVELMVSCQCKIIIVMGTLVCWTLQQWTLILHYLFYLFIHYCFNPRHGQNNGAGTIVYLPWYIAIYVVLRYHHHFISHHFGCFPPHAPLMNVFVLFGGGHRFIMLSDWWNGGGSIGASGLRLI